MERRVEIPYVESLSNRDLMALNELLPWQAYVVDAQGRRFGNRAYRGKRSRPQEVPDRRIVLMDQFFGLGGKRVLEIGCFEGIHTVALCARARSVTAADSRIENVVKTIVRAAFFGASPQVLLWDVESPPPREFLPPYDLIHHVGVLYHLKDPAAHLLSLGRLAREGIMVDTHYATPDMATASYVCDGRRISYRHAAEFGRADAFSGMYNHAKWLTLEAIKDLLVSAGFADIIVVEDRLERNGPRVMLFERRQS